MKHNYPLTARWLPQLCASTMLLAWLGTGARAADPIPPQAQYVIVISVDGLGGTYLNKKIKSFVPMKKKLEYEYE